MMELLQLCANREEGFGPSSTFASPLPTSCFTDSIIIPLPTWLYLSVVPVLVFVTSFRRSRDFNPSTAHLRVRRRRSFLRGFLVGIYYFMLAANAFMQTLEIVRLKMIFFGIGLIPFTYVALLLALILHATNGLGGRIYERYWIAANTAVFLGLMIVTIFKIVGLLLTEWHGVSRRGSKYQMADQVADMVAMTGVFIVLAVAEALLGMWKNTKIAVQGGDNFMNGNLRTRRK